LSRALDLVHGQLLDGCPPGRYAWLAADPVEYEATARVADAGHRLAELRLAAGDAQGAMAAARAGLRLAFNDELLWRDLLTAVLAAAGLVIGPALRSLIVRMSVPAGQPWRRSCPCCEGPLPPARTTSAAATSRAPARGPAPAAPRAPVTASMSASRPRTALPVL